MAKHIIILAGGPSSEHEISLKTADEIIKNLDFKKYLAKKVVITKTGRWLMPQETVNHRTKFGVGMKLSSVRSRNLVLPEKQAINLFKNQQIDAVFIAMHGEYGEDGKVQGLLELAGIPYTGSGVLASALGMDKTRSLGLLKSAGFFVPAFIELSDKATRHQNFGKIFAMFGFPLVVKPADRGSSVGVSVVKNKADFAAAIEKARKFSKRLMVQKFVDGREITCGVLEKSKRLVALPPVEILPKAGEFYDYKSKYREGGSEHIIPPEDLTKDLLDLIKNRAILAHQVIGCSGMSRSDFILSKDDKLYILEINTIPGMTKTSLLPEAAKTIGIGFSALLDLIIQSAFRKK